MSESPEAAAPAVTPAVPPAAATRVSSGRSARLVAAGILLSRASGYLRTSIIANFLGTSLFASAFSAALRLPGFLQNLLGEGTLSASFIPAYSRLLEEGRERDAGRLAGATFALLLVVAGGLAVIGVTLAPVLVRLAYWKYTGELYDVTVRCVRIIFPMTGVLVLSAWALGILNSHRKFFVSYVAPVAWNAAIIAVAFVASRQLIGIDFVVALSWGALAGGVLQLIVQVPFLLRLERSLVLRLDPQAPGFRQVLRNAGPAIMGRGVVQLSAYLDMGLASFLFTGAVATLSFAQMLYVLPVSLFGMAVAAAELPEMARDAGGRLDALRARLATGQERIAFFVIPTVAAYIVLGDVVVGALYQWGEFQRADTLLVYAVLAAYSVGLLASTSTRLYSSALYAVDDTRTPAKIALIRVIVAAAAGAALMFLLERYAIRADTLSLTRTTEDTTLLRPLGAAGLALGSGLAACLELALLRRTVASRVGAGLDPSSVFAPLTAAAFIPAVLLRLLVFVLPELEPRLLALIVLPLFGGGYLLLAHVLGVQRARDLVRAVLRRSGGGRNGSG